MRNVKVGLIGPGRNPNGYGIGHFLAREVLNYDLSSLIAIMGKTSQSVKKEILSLNARSDVIKKFNGSIYTANEKDSFFCNNEINLVVICSPVDTHREYIERSIASGKHVLVEKPLIKDPSLSIEQEMEITRKLVNLARKKKLLLSTNCQRVAIVPVLSKGFGYPQHPSYAEIRLKIGASNGRILSPAGLFELLITHPLSLLIKYGIKNLESVRIKEYRSGINANSCFLSILGNALSKNKNLDFKIELQQSEKYAFTIMEVDLNHKGTIEVFNEFLPDGDVKTKYLKLDKPEHIKYSEDNLKESVVRMIDGVYYNNKKRKPLISCLETYLIYALEKTIRKAILLKYGNI